MDYELRRLAWVITDLTFKLELATVREFEASIAQGEQKYDAPEFYFLECEARLYQMRARELKAKIVAAHSRIARLTLAAQLELLRSQQRPAAEVELEQLRSATKKAMEDQRRAAMRVIREACNMEKACHRIEGKLAMPKSPPDFDVRLQPEVPQQHEQYRGRTL